MRSIWIVFFCFFNYNIIKVNRFLYRFIILLHLISCFSLTRSLIVPYAHISIEPIDCILSLSFELRAILLIYSVKTLCLLLINLCYIFNIDLVFLMTCLRFLRLSMLILFFSRYFILLSS